MRVRFLGAVVVAVWGMCLAVAPANALSFSFSFTNTANGSGTAVVEGIIRGLLDDVSNQPATSLEVTANPDGFGIGEYIGAPTSNSFNVAGGAITGTSFFAFGADNAFPFVTCCSLALSTQFGTGLTADPDQINANSSVNLQFSPISETPLPAALPMFASGLGAIGLLAWRRRKNTAAV